jgi:hypothetical protein
LANEVRHETILLPANPSRNPLRFSSHTICLSFGQFGAEMDIVLNDTELAELDRQDPATEDNGGFQSLMVGLQKRVDRATGNLSLTRRDLERIRSYAFDYKNGGWQGRLIRAFGRHLGPRLDGVLLAT